MTTTTNTTVRISHPTDRPNFTLVTVGELALAFSYETVIAFNDGSGWKLRVNEWGPTTGKHLNWLPQGDGTRYGSEHFEALLATALT